MGDFTHDLIPKQRRPRPLTLQERADRLTPERLEAIAAKRREHSHNAGATRRARKKNAATEPVRRSDIIERDDSTCYLCDRRVPNHDIHLDHIIPLARGGSHTADNLAVTCSTCNIQKAAHLTTKRPKALLQYSPDQ